MKSRQYHSLDFVWKCIPGACWESSCHWGFRTAGEVFFAFAHLHIFLLFVFSHLLKLIFLITLLAGGSCLLRILSWYFTFLTISLRICTNILLYFSHFVCWKHSWFLSQYHSKHTFLGVYHETKHSFCKFEGALSRMGWQFQWWDSLFSIDEVKVFRQWSDHLIPHSMHLKTNIVENMDMRQSKKHRCADLKA